MKLESQMDLFAFSIFVISFSVKCQGYDVKCQGDDGYSNYNKYLNAEAMLFRHILNDSHYEPNVRPAHNATAGPTELQLGVELIQMYGIDEERQVIELLVWMQKSWTDERLSWDPEKYDGIQHIRVPHKKIWRPDIALFNGAFEAGEDSGFGHIYDALALVYSNGKVLWIPPARIKASCPMDITNFPFDKQNCSLKLGSWTYSGEQVNPVFYNGNQDFSYTYYRHNNVWELEKTYAVKHDVKYACCEETYPDLTFSVQLARRRSYYSYMLVVPGIIMALLLPVMFLLPVGRSEKFILGCSLLVCLTLMTLLLEMMVPTAHSGVPFIEAYYLANFILTAISLAVSATILNLSQCQSRPPDFFRKVIDMCAKCCCINMPRHSYRNFKIHMNPRSDENPIAMDQMDQEGPPLVPYNSDWFVIATVMDRFFLAVSFIIALLVTIGMASHS